MNQFVLTLEVDVLDPAYLYEAARTIVIDELGDDEDALDELGSRRAPAVEACLLWILSRVFVPGADITDTDVEAQS